jgi:sarcosine oxidase subunit gamma
VADLIAKSPLAGAAPLTQAGVTLSEADPGQITSIAPFDMVAVGKALKTLGLAFPEPNRFSAREGVRLAWTGRDQAFLMGVAPPEGLAEAAALTNQSDGWACLRLQGEGIEAVLARLVPVDVRLAALPVGSSIRVPLNHMNAILIRVGAETADLLVFRSMARTAWHEVEAALSALAARAALT